MVSAKPTRTSIPVWTNFLKPACSTVSSYGPVGRLGKAYTPAWVVVTLNCRPVGTWIATTLAAGTTAPAGSVTVPESDPVSPCDHKTTGRIENANKKIARMLQTLIRFTKCSDSEAEEYTLTSGLLIGSILLNLEFCFPKNFFRRHHPPATGEVPKEVPPAPENGRRPSIPRTEEQHLSQEVPPS